MQANLPDELFQLGQLAADLLGRFVEIQDGIRSWRVVLFVPIDFEQHATDARGISECLDSLLERLELLADVAHSSTTEDEFIQALGHYLCALKNSVGAYERLTGVIGYHSRKQRIRGVYRVFRLRRDFDRTVDDYRRRGLVLQDAWNALENTQPIDGPDRWKLKGKSEVTDDLNPETQWAGEDKEFMAFLRDATTPKTELARAYVAATSTEQLLTLAVKPLCLSAADIFFILNPLGPLDVDVAVLQGLLIPKYWAASARTNALFVECLLCVVKKFEEFCRRAGVDLSVDQFETLATSAAYNWQSRNRYPESEKNAFRDQVVKILGSHTWYPSEDSDRLRRIMDAAGKRPSDKDLVELIMVTQDPIMRLEPVFFVERFKQLTDKQSFPQVLETGRETCRHIAEGVRNLDDKMNCPAGRILTWAYNLAGESDDFLKAQFPGIVKYPNRESFGNFLQIAMIVAALLRIERYLASSNYATLHTSIIESIAPSVRHLYVPLLHELSAFLLQTNLESLPKNELPSFKSLLAKDEEQLSRGIAIWVIGKTKGSKPQEPDFALINAITQLACTSNAQIIASFSLSDGKSPNRIV